MSLIRFAAQRVISKNRLFDFIKRELRLFHISMESSDRVHGEAAITEKRPQFGGRLLTDPENVYKHNAWDNVEWDEEQQQSADRMVKANSSRFVDKDVADKYESDASVYWDNFYLEHQDGFFKDRHWLFTEFPELAQSRGPSVDSGDTTFIKTSSATVAHPTAASFPGASVQRRILEVGCGVGNTVFPLLEQVSDPDLFIYCCDFSTKAVELLKKHSLYDPNRCHAFVSDITVDPLPMPFPEGSIDIICMIFVLSAVDPAKMRTTVAHLARYLKPGGLMLLRDYGRYDMAQLRFKTGRCISDNFYVRGDGTRVYFFTADELDEMLREAGLVKEVNYVDRRLQVNRGKMLKMYRVWIQCKYRKPASQADDTPD